MKKYNAISLDVDKDEPSFVNDKAKFWLLSSSSNNRFSVFRVQSFDGKLNSFIITDNKSQSVISESTSLESISSDLELYEKVSENGWMDQIT